MTFSGKVQSGEDGMIKINELWFIGRKDFYGFTTHPLRLTMSSVNDLILAPLDIIMFHFQNRILILMMDV